MSKSWSVVETKARLSEVLKKAAHAPQIIESRGAPVAVIMGIEEFTALRQRAGETADVTPMQRLLAASGRLRQSGDGTNLGLPSRADRETVNLAPDTA